MSESRLAVAQALFDELVRVPADQRLSLLAIRCGGDGELHSLVERLLKNDDSGMGGFLRRQEWIADRLAPAMPTRIGNYEIVREIGRGGAGVVYEARQDGPRRTVALKVIGAGFVSRDTLRRFAQEAEILGYLQHPGIAQIYEAGAAEIHTRSGAPATVPYFAMELVHGEPLTHYCDRERLSLPQRLRLFGKICNAVQHAHQKGVIHRDLKPSNVLVTLADAAAPAQPKVIDFGIAKVAAVRLADRPMFTELYQAIGTPEYMSPEQADPSATDIDTRSDVYALGAMLYELLTGSTPLESHRLRSASLADIQRLIRVEEPPRPSIRLAALAAASGANGHAAAPNPVGEFRESRAVEIAKRRRSEPASLTRALRGDLDWIVMKCLEKDPARRYETADALAEDISRFLDREPVRARPPSTAYRLQKFVSRYRGRVIAVAAVALAVLLGLVGTSAGWLYAVHERDRANGEATRANLAVAAARTAESAAHQSAETARHEAQRASEIKLFLASMLEGIDPTLAQGRDSTVLRLVVDDAIKRLENGEIADAVIEAELRNTLGRLLHSLGDLERAETMTRRALALRIERLGERHPDTLNSMDLLGSVLKDRARLDEAETLMLRAVELRRAVLGDDHEDTLVSLNNLGVVRQVQGRLAEAEEIFKQVLDRRSRLMGDDEPATLASRANYAFVIDERGRPVEAEAILRDVLEKQRRILGPDHPTTINTLATWAGVLGRGLGRIPEAEVALREAVERSQRVLGESHAATLTRTANLAAALTYMHRYDEAESMLRPAYERSRARFGLNHVATLLACANLAGVLNQLGRPADSELLYREAIAAMRETFGATNPNTLAFTSSFSGTLESLGKLDEAEAVALEALEGCRRELSPAHPRTIQCAGRLASVLIAQKRFGEAERELLAAHELLRSARPDSTPEKRSLAQTLVKLYTAWQSAEPRDEHAQAASDWRAKLAEADAAAAGVRDPQP